MIGRARTDHARRIVWNLPPVRIDGTPTVRGRSVRNILTVDEGLDDQLKAAGMHGAKARDYGRPGTVRLAHLVSTEPTLSRDRLLSLLEAGAPGSLPDDLIIVAIFHGRGVVWNGNHRINAKMLCGETYAEAQVLAL